MEVYFLMQMNTELKIRIDWADLDLFGHVNNVAFFRYIQAARVNFCDAAGLTSLNEADKLSFMVASSRCQFKKPLYYPGHVKINTRCDWTKNSSFQLSYTLTDEVEKLLAEGQDVLVVFDHRKKIKVNISDALKSSLGPLDGGQRNIHEP
jgi:acyl-CoA thioester hydrolase